MEIVISCFLGACVALAGMASFLAIKKDFQNEDE